MLKIWATISIIQSCEHYRGRAGAVSAFFGQERLQRRVSQTFHSIPFGRLLRATEYSGSILAAPPTTGQHNTIHTIKVQ